MVKYKLVNADLAFVFVHEMISSVDSLSRSLGQPDLMHDADVGKANDEQWEEVLEGGNIHVLLATSNMMVEIHLQRFEIMMILGLIQ